MGRGTAPRRQVLTPATCKSDLMPKPDLGRCDEIKDLELGKLVQTTRVGPVVSSFTGAKQREVAV